MPIGITGSACVWCFLAARMQQSYLYKEPTCLHTSEMGGVVFQHNYSLSARWFVSARTLLSCKVSAVKWDGCMFPPGSGCIQHFPNFVTVGKIVAAVQ